MPRLAYTKLAPDGFRHLLELHSYLAQSGLGEGLLNLVYLRVSQINGCPYCVDLHAGDLRKAGEDERRLSALVVWRDTPFFKERERAALAWAEAVTRLNNQHASDEEYQAARQQFSEKELADLTLAVANINAFNRLAIAFHVTPAAPR